MSQDLVSPADSKPAVTKFSLDQVKMQWSEFLMRRKRHAEDKQWLDEFKALLKKVSDNADQYLLNNRTVARLTPGQLNLSDLSKEQPDVVKKYTRIIAEEKFDEETFRKDEPELYEQYRARRLTLVSGAPDIDGLS